jgi:hypothetical protein
MWSYRDWVIKAFNDNMPFDRFTLEQLAGDLLPKPTLEQQIASGFNRSHITSNEGGLIDEEYLVLYTRDRTETTSAVWLGMTANCATCHDHKFDPLAQREFYELSSFFNNTTIPAKDGNRRDPPPVAVVPTPEDRERWFELASLVPKAKEELDARRKAARPDYEAWLPTATPEPFRKEIPTKDLLFHARLTEGKGDTFKYKVEGESHSFKAKTNITWGSGYIAERSFKSTKNVAVELRESGRGLPQSKTLARVLRRTNSVRLWTAAVLCRFRIQRRGLLLSRALLTLGRDETYPCTGSGHDQFARNCF